MADDQDKLRETLEQLHAQLDEMRKVDPKVAEHLSLTIGRARAVLGGEQVQPAARNSLLQQLRNTLHEYEVTHPMLAGNLGSIIDALAGMGI